MIHGDSRCIIRKKNETVGNALFASRDIDEDETFVFWGILNPDNTKEDNNDYEMWSTNGNVDPTPLGHCMKFQFANAPPLNADGSTKEGHFGRTSNRSLTYRLHTEEIEEFPKEIQVNLSKYMTGNAVTLGGIKHDSIKHIPKDEELLLEYGPDWFEERSIVRV